MEPVVGPATSGQEAVLAVIQEAALTLPTSHAHRLADAICTASVPTPAIRVAATGAVPAPAFRDVARKLLEAWQHAPGLHGSAIALSLRSAAGAVDMLRSSQSIDIVWTGPASSEVPVRLTSAVLQATIDSARSSLLIVSFAAYKVPGVVEALGAAVGRGVDVRMILETSEHEGGTLRFGAAQAFEQLEGSVAFYVWPSSRRPALSNGATASMHAKAAVADEHTALVGSANLTGMAIEANMELGLFVRGGPVPRRLSRHFRTLISAGVLTPLG